MKKTLLIPAVAYYRMSSDQQETSIGDQRIAVRKYAAENGYQILREYVDEGISGWRSDRDSFQRLISDAEKREFQAVLCWDQDRFSRFEPDEANYYLFILKRSGVRLCTVNQGIVSLDGIVNFLTASIAQHAKHEYCRDLGRNVARGQRTRKLLGQWIGAPPLGYVLGEDGFLALGNPADVALVRRIFQLRADGKGQKMIALILNKEGVPTRRGLKWCSQMVRTIINRKTYLGHAVIGEKARGKYARIVDEVTTVPNVHPAIIDQDLWDRVQVVNGSNMLARHKGDGEGSPLAGLVRCADCGCDMYSQRFKGNDSFSKRALYVCSRGHNQGDCFHNTIHQDPLLEVVLKKLRDVMGLNDRKRLEAEVSRLLAKEGENMPGVDVHANKKRILEIDRQLSTAAGRLLSLPDNLIATVQAKMVELQQERDRLSRIKATPKRAAGITVKDAIAAIDSVDDILSNGSPSEIRRELSQIIESITLKFETYKTTADGRTWRRPTTGEIVFRSTNGELPSQWLFPVGKRRVILTKSDMAPTVPQIPWNKGKKGSQVPWNKGKRKSAGETAS